MSEKIELASEILENNIDGFHRYCFAAPAHLTFASQSLCDMVGYSSDELTLSQTDVYASLVHPEDQDRYRVFRDALASREQRLTLQYRLMRRNGTVLYVHDAMFSRRESGEALSGYSVLTDITSIKQENEALHSLNATVPCGILKYTCEENPRVTYVNEQMLRMLRFPPEALFTPSLLDLSGQNLYLFISPEERARFSHFLKLVESQDKPIAGETTALRYDGTKIRLYGWISKYIDADGKEGFQSVCMDVTDRYERKRRAEEQQYLRALAQVYDEIFSLDLLKKSVRILHGASRSLSGTMADMPLALEDAAEYWLEHVVLPDDRSTVRTAFERLLLCEAQGQEQRPLEIQFHARQPGQDVRCYMGVFLKTGGSNYLLCCRNITSQMEAKQLKLENTELRGITEQMQELVMHYTDGMLAFEICGDSVRPLYFSDNVCQFFGYSKEEWVSIMHTMTPIPEFVSKCHIPYDSFLDLLENRDAEFYYTDVATNKARRIKAIRTSRVSAKSKRYYVMLYDVTDKNASDASAPESALRLPEVFIRTFGYFDVFVNGNPIAFRNEKAKELFALLVDRRGGFVTSSEAIAHLWEDEPASSVTLARYRKVALRLKNTLEEYGIADIVESVDGKRRIVTQLVQCDLFDYLTGEPQHAQLFKGSYLQNYSWGERTLAELNG